MMVGGEEGEGESNHWRRSFNRPSWLLCTIADLDEKMNMLTKKRRNNPDSFTERASSYYDERPHLLALLDHLYVCYLSLADRYCQVLIKNEHTSCEEEATDSDAESSLSFQPECRKEKDADMIVADLVMKNVECDIAVSELFEVERRWGESSKKLELQNNLLDVLESERYILLNENATLSYRVNALVEENKGLVSDSLFLKRCVLKTTEDHGLSRKIEGLQRQIHVLEKRNKEYCDQLVKQDKGVYGLRKCFSFNVKKVEVKKVSKLWDKVRKLNLFHK